MPPIETIQDTQGATSEPPASTASSSQVVAPITELSADPNQPDTTNLPVQRAPPSHPSIDPTIPGTFDSRSIFDLDIAAMHPKPWRLPGTDLSDYFNYGFDEITWEAYCYRRRETADVGAALKANVLAFAGMGEESLANVPVEVRAMVMAGTNAMMNGAMGPAMGGGMGPGPGMGGGMGGMSGPMGMNAQGGVPPGMLPPGVAMGMNPMMAAEMGMPMGMPPMGMGMNGDMGMGMPGPGGPGGPGGPLMQVPDGPGGGSGGGGGGVSGGVGLGAANVQSQVHGQAGAANGTPEPGNVGLPEGYGMGDFIMQVALVSLFPLYPFTNR